MYSYLHTKHARAHTHHTHTHVVGGGVCSLSAVVAIGICPISPMLPALGGVAAAAPAESHAAWYSLSRCVPMMSYAVSSPSGALVVLGVVSAVPVDAGCGGDGWNIFCNPGATSTGATVAADGGGVGCTATHGVRVAYAYHTPIRQ